MGKKYKDGRGGERRGYGAGRCNNRLLIKIMLNWCYNFIESIYIDPMNIAAEDICRKEFDNLKFRKSNARYIVFKIAHEKIVSLWSI